MTTSTQHIVTTSLAMWLAAVPFSQHNAAGASYLGLNVGTQCLSLAHARLLGIPGALQPGVPGRCEQGQRWHLCRAT
jgi:hypothetical protein